MLFYKCVVYIKSENRDSHLGRRGAYEIGHPIAVKCDAYNERIAEKGLLFIGSATPDQMQFGLFLYAPEDAEEMFKDFLRRNHLTYEKLQCSEVTFSILLRLVNSADSNDLIMDDDELLSEVGLGNLSGRKSNLNYDEMILKEGSEKEIYRKAANYFSKDSLNPELDRIFLEEKKTRFCGHPVHYMVQASDPEVQIGMAKLLLQSLYEKGRIVTKRYTALSLKQWNEIRLKTLENLYTACAGGAILIGYADFEKDDEDDLVGGEMDNLLTFCDMANRYRRTVLTIFCIPRNRENLKQKIRENMVGCTFVEIEEEPAYGERAEEYLKQLASESKIRTDKQLLSQIEEGTGYLAKDLNQIFDEWYGKKLKNQIFKQYKDFDSVKEEVKEEKPKGSAYDELNEMIGLSSAKTVISQALDNYKALKLFKNKGIKADEASRHMIFTGNPGTAKTTVARLFARIMKENGLVSSGQIIEVGRGDLVGRYVGWTAQIIQKKFKEAKGGILFIDEAYSLVDDRDGSYGDEAINTIVQEMENNRDDVIVIFAGYPDKMEGFMQKNPGLRSRIAFHVNFEDYTPDELCQIAELIAKQKGVELDESAMTKLHGIMESASGETDFGNGRYVRNIIENAKRAQSSRLLKMDVEAVTTKDVRTICAEDILEPCISAKKTARVIGFAV